jgi:hypothetical protein
MAGLTRAERRLRDEIEEIASLVKMDVWNIKDYEGDERRYRLQEIKDRLVRSEVILKYALIDEFLTDVICIYYFRKPKKTLMFQQLWRTKHSRIFVHYIMDEMSLLKKLAVVEAITKVPRDISNAIQRINTVRNALAHSLFPENRRRYMGEKKVQYKGVHLFTPDGVKLFQDDYWLASRYFIKKLF